MPTNIKSSDVFRMLQYIRGNKSTPKTPFEEIPQSEAGQTRLGLQNYIEGDPRLNSPMAYVGSPVARADSVAAEKAGYNWWDIPESRRKPVEPPSVSDIQASATRGLLSTLGTNATPADTLKTVARANALAAIPKTPTQLNSEEKARLEIATRSDDPAIRNPAIAKLKEINKIEKEIKTDPEKDYEDARSKSLTLKRTLDSLVNGKNLADVMIATSGTDAENIFASLGMNQESINGMTPEEQQQIRQDLIQTIQSNLAIEDEKIVRYDLNKQTPPEKHGGKVTKPINGFRFKSDGSQWIKMPPDDEIFGILEYKESIGEESKKGEILDDTNSGNSYYFDGNDWLYYNPE